MLKFFSITFAILLAISLTKSQNAGTINVRNSGAYMARYWITFNLNGQQLTYSTDSFAAGQSRILQLPVNSCCARLTVQNLIFISTWRDVFSVDINLPMGQRCFSVWGTTLIPYWGEEGC